MLVAVTVERGVHLCDDLLILLRAPYFCVSSFPRTEKNLSQMVSYLGWVSSRLVHAFDFNTIIWVKFLVFIRNYISPDWMLLFFFALPQMSLRIKVWGLLPFLEFQLHHFPHSSLEQSAYRLTCSIVSMYFEIYIMVSNWSSIPGGGENQ